MGNLDGGRAMSDTKKGLIFAAIGAGSDVVLGLAFGRAVMRLPWGSTGALAAVLVLFGGLFGFFTGRKDTYSFAPRAIWAFILDISWSLINTLTGLVWMIWCVAKGTYRAPTDETQKRGIIVFNGAALGGAGATTLGTVIGGDWMLHEAVHVQQARIFGPLYWPTYLASYVTNLLIRFLTARFSDPHWEAYARVVMEDWAYRAAPDPAPGKSAEIKPLQSFIWFMVALANALAIVVLIHPLARALGIGLIPWSFALMLILVYALGRSYLPKADEHVAPYVFT